MQNFVRWSSQSLPGGELIKQLPVLSLEEFVEVINNPAAHVPYREDVEGKRYNPGIFNTNDTLFLDIDHIDDYFDCIWNALEDIIVDCPFIAMVKQSRSKSLHFICIGHWNTVEEHVIRDMFYLACVAKSIKLRTGIDLREVEKALDVHTKSCNQRLFVYDPSKHPYIINPYPTMVSLDGEDELFAEYPMLLPTKPRASKRASVKEESFKGTFDATFRETTERITLDRNYEVCGYYGNDARWRIANAIAYLCHNDLEQAKHIIMNNFRNYNDFSFASVSKGVNHNVLNWVITNLQNRFGGECTYLTEKIDEILQFIASHPRTLLVAPTGTGKTTLINGMPGFIGLAKRLNAVVITPFNSMLHLYNNMASIRNDGYICANLDDYRSDEPVVIIWDQVNKLLGRIIEDHRPVIIDESHTLFLDRNYRDSAVSLMKKLKGVSSVIAVTATPTGEEEELGLERLEYRSRKGVVNATFRYTKSNVGLSLLGDIIYNNEHSNYDRIVVFSDLYARRLHENLDVRLIPHAFIHSKNRVGKDFITLQETEKLTEKITICTSLAYNGLNFKNENENVLVLMDVHEGQTLSSHIIQCVGRLRRSAVSVKLYMVSAGDRSTVEQKKLKTDLVTTSNVDYEIVSCDGRLNDPDTYEALQIIEKYTAEHSTFEMIKSELQETGYFFISDQFDSEASAPIHSQLQLKEKRKMEELWLEGFMKGAHPMNEEVTTNEYYRAVDRLWRDLVWKYAISPESVMELLVNKNSYKHVSTVLVDLSKKYHVNTHTDEEYNKMISSIEHWIKDHGPSLGPRIVNQFKRNLKDMKKWREKYSPCMGDMYRILEIDVEALWDTIQQQKETASKAHSGSHKKMTYRYEDFTGTVEEIAERFDKASKTIRRWIKEGKVVKC